MPEPFRFLHLADLHLDTPFRGHTEAVREALRRATREAFEAAVTTAIDRGAHAVLLAGDVFDGDLLTFATERFLLDGCCRLEEAGIQVVYATGNHDPGSLVQKRFQWPANVHVARSARPQTVTISDSEGEPVGRVVAAGHTRAHEGRTLASRFPAQDGTMPVVGLVHTQVSGAASADAHDAYAPSERTDFEKPGFHYWALGHIHQRQQVFADLPVYYPGNLQGRHFGETGPKGGLWVEIPPFGLPEVTFLPLAPLAWQWTAIHEPVSDSLDALVAELAAAVPATEAEQRVVRMDVTGASPLAGELADDENRAELGRQLALHLGALDVAVRVHGLHRPLDLAAVRRTASPTATALELLGEAEADDALVDRLAAAPLSPDAPTDPDERRAYVRGLLADLGPELAERLVSDEGPA